MKNNQTAFNDRVVLHPKGVSTHASNIEVTIPALRQLHAVVKEMTERTEQWNTEHPDQQLPVLDALPFFRVNSPTLGLTLVTLPDATNILGELIWRVRQELRCDPHALVDEYVIHHVPAQFGVIIFNPDALKFKENEVNPPRNHDVVKNLFDDKQPPSICVQSTYHVSGLWSMSGVPSGAGGNIQMHLTHNGGVYLSESVAKSRSPEFLFNIEDFVKYQYYRVLTGH